MPGPSLWVSCPRRRAEARLRLYCFPYAGGGAGIYRQWPGELPDFVEVWTILLPGRERRVSERPIASIPALADAVAGGLIDHLEPPFAFFGHSMGALVAFELTRRLRDAAGSLPYCLVVSGFGAPYLPGHRRIAHLPAAEFVAELLKLGGTPAGVLENAELVELLLPALRADHQAVEEYCFSHDEPLPCTLYAYGGTHDREVTWDDLDGWRTCTTGEFAVRLFRGDHFYLHAQRSELTAQLGRDLVATLRT